METGRGARAPFFPWDKCHTWWPCGCECYQRTEVGNDGDVASDGRAMKCDVDADNDKPAFRRAVKWSMFGRATFNREGTRIRKSGHAFPDATRIMNKRARYTRRESELDDGAEGWCTAVRFFNNSAYFERLFCRVEECDHVTREHYKVRRLASC